MDLVHWKRHPDLNHPLFVVAFEGWNDAGDASSLALDFMADSWKAERFATIDCEEFYDFTVTRPQVRLTGSENPSRRIEWPDIELLAAQVPGAGHDLVLVRGVEPQLKWRTFSAAVLSVAKTVGAELAVILGSLLADVPHTRPVRVSGTTDDRDLASRLGLAAPSYEGPTGIVGVVHHAFWEAGIPTASFWAAVPHYVHQVPSPKAALALVERSAALLGAPVDSEELQEAAEDYERQVSERIADDADAAAYVAQLEDADDTGWAGEDGFGNSAGPHGGNGGNGGGGFVSLGDIDALATEVERFLRDHRRED